MPTERPLEQPLNRPIRLAACISGGGTTVMNLVDKIAAGELEAEIPLVIASRQCAGIDKARDAGLPVLLIERKRFDSVAQFSDELFRAIDHAGADLVVLAGFLSLLEIPARYRLQVLNVHPGLIPAFCGKGYHGGRVHAAALARGVQVSGCTVHFADNEYDHGPILIQETVPVLDDDTPESLAARVFAAECEAYPAAIRRFASGQLVVEDGRVKNARI